MLILKQITLLKRILLSTLMFFLVPGSSSFAQQVIFNRVSSPEGSYFGLINDITQDLQGYMWFAIWGGGLRRYDGYHFITYMNDPMDSASLAVNTLHAVCADHNGIIWIGTEESGLDRLDTKTGIFTHFRHEKQNPKSLSDDRITTIKEDHAGTIWIGTKNWLNRLDQKTKTFTRYYYEPKDSTSLSNNFVQVLYEDRRHTLWVGTRSQADKLQGKGGLNRLDQKTNKFTRYQHDPGDPHSLLDNSIGAIFEDSKGNFWVSTAGHGLHIMDRERGIFERLSYDPADPSKLSGPPRNKEVDQDIDLFFICEDGTGVIWIGASGGYITRYDPQTKKAMHYNSINDDVQSMRSVSGGFTSREGVLWITTWAGSIFRADPFHNNISHYPTGNIVHAIHEDFSGTLWVGTFFEGIIRVDRAKGNIKRYLNKPAPNEMHDSWITAFYEENDSALWIGSGNGLYLFNRKKGTFVRYKNDPRNENSLSKGVVAVIIEDQPGSLWIATGEGLDQLDIKTGAFRHFRNNSKDGDSLRNNEFTSLLKDHSGNLWLGTFNGNLHRFDPRTGTFKHFICGINIGNIVEDFENIIWVGTSNGLYRSNAAVDSFSRFTDAGIGLTATTIVAGILEDDQKNLWVSSSFGIFRINHARNEIRVYNKNQGVDASGLAFFLMRGEKGRHGELFFGNRTGYYAFFPGQFKSNTTPPQIVINEFRLADQPVKAGNGSPLKLPIAQTKEIDLSYKQNVFSFDFAGIHYCSPEDNQHLFMLENLDNSWRKAGLEKKAFYYNVPPGRYVFHVKASNSYGVWAEKSIAIIITPPWWSTWWAYTLYIVVFLIALWSFIKWREKALKKEKILLEEKVAIRTHELQDEKEKVETTLSELKATQDQLVQSEKMAALSKLQQAMLNERLRISRELHDDIGSTLSGIVLYSHLAENQVHAHQADEVKNSLNTIQQSANAMVSKLNDIVWSVNPEHNSLKSLLQKLEEYATEMAMAKNMKVRVNTAGSLAEFQLPVETCHNIYLLGKEAINNAVKYSHASLLELSVQHFDHVMEFTIRDNGEGFDMTAVKKGNGLMNMQKRADEAAAILSVRSVFREGTIISLQCKITQ